jgi:hypothetical protein
LLQTSTSRASKDQYRSTFDIEAQSFDIGKCLNANIEDSSISKQSDIEENASNIEDSSISGGSHIPDIGSLSFWVLLYRVLLY